MDRNNLEEMYDYFPYYYSEKAVDYFSSNGVHNRCRMPCDEDHPYFWSNIPFKELQSLDKSKEYDIAVFGCSNTFGQTIPITDTWPHLLSERSARSVLNFGAPACGIDGIWQNIQASNEEWNYQDVIIVFPEFVRRIATHGKFKWPVVVSEFHPTPWDWTHYKDPIGKNLKIDREKIDSISEDTLRQIVLDESDSYGKEIIDKIIDHCEKNFRRTFYSTWDQDVSRYLETKDISRLSIYDLNGPRGFDGVHPTRVQNQAFVDAIIGTIS